MNFAVREKLFTIKNDNRGYAYLTQMPFYNKPKKAFLHGMEPKISFRMIPKPGPKP